MGNYFSTFRPNPPTARPPVPSPTHLAPDNHLHTITLYGVIVQPGPPVARKQAQQGDFCRAGRRVRPRRTFND
jgi:hypothetical protein